MNQDLTSKQKEIAYMAATGFCLFYVLFWAVIAISGSFGWKIEPDPNWAANLSSVFMLAVGVLLGSNHTIRPKPPEPTVEEKKG